MLKSTALRHYLLGLAAGFVGAWLTEVTASMLPLAMGASVAVMCTAPLVKQVWNRRRKV